MNVGPTFFDDTIIQAILLYPQMSQMKGWTAKTEKKKSHQKTIEILH